MGSGKKMAMVSLENVETTSVCDGAKRRTRPRKHVDYVQDWYFVEYLKHLEREDELRAYPRNPINPAQSKVYEQANNSTEDIKVDAAQFHLQKYGKPVETTTPDTKQQENFKEGDETAVKRGRGRPRKSPEEQNSTKNLRKTGGNWFDQSNPDQCLSTDGRSWRCCNERIPGQKYCSRHLHRTRKKPKNNILNGVLPLSPPVDLEHLTSNQLALDQIHDISLPLALEQADVTPNNLLQIAQAADHINLRKLEVEMKQESNEMDLRREIERLLENEKKMKLDIERLHSEKMHLEARNREGVELIVSVRDAYIRLKKQYKALKEPI